MISEQHNWARIPSSNLECENNREIISYLLEPKLSSLRVKLPPCRAFLLPKLPPRFPRKQPERSQSRHVFTKKQISDSKNCGSCFYSGRKKRALSFLKEIEMQNFSKPNSQQSSGDWSFDRDEPRLPTSLMKSKGPAHRSTDRLTADKIYF